MAAAVQIQKGPSIAARARCDAVYVGLEQLRAANSVEQPKAVDIGRATVYGAHGAGCTQAQQFGLFACSIGVAELLQAFFDKILFHRSGLHNFANAIGGQARRHGIAAQGQDGFNIGPAFDVATHCRLVAVDITDPDAGVRATLDNVIPNAIIIAGAAAVIDFSGFKLEHFRSFLTRSADYSDDLGPSYKAEGPSVSSGYYALGNSWAQHGAKAACQYIKCARSGRVADAVRERSLNATPARLMRSRSHVSFFVTLTPARWGAYRLASQISASIGSGGAVLARTVQNQRQNFQHIEIITQSVAVLWFRDFASRHAWAGVRVRLCAYTREGNSRTSEPVQYNYIYHIDVGSRSGSARFWPEPALPTSVECDGFLRFSHKIVGRYRSNSASSGLLLGCPGESFGVFGRRAADRAAAGLDVDQARANDGFMRVSAGRSGLVGMAMLERCPQRRRNARYSGNRPLPIGKASACAQVPAGTPPMPPLPATISPSSLPPETNRIWIRFLRLNHSGTMRDRQGGARRNGWRRIGSGKGWPVRFDPVDTGRGMQKTAGKLHRICQAIGGAADVN